MKVALVISTYNWPQALRSVLRSIATQSRKPDEVLIADDGSGPETESIIEFFTSKLEMPVKHIWQEDRGFRKSAVLNKALSFTNADYIIQIDGDCILHPQFIRDHLAGVEEGTFLYGSRVNIFPGAVQKVLKMKNPRFPIFSSAIKNKSRNLRIPFFQKLYGSKTKFSNKTRGCNLSYWRKDLIGVNGYDETMEGWGREDSELVIRMLNNGVKGKRLRYGGILYHIYHPEKSREFLLKNSEIQTRTIEENIKWCSEGIDKYLRASRGKDQ
jgi:glycosyltransferase involved in cell wall biosynthesis